jgi:hypothetical protein
MGYDGLAQVVVTYGLLAIATVPGAHKGAQVAHPWVLRRRCPERGQGDAAAAGARGGAQAGRSISVRSTAIRSLRSPPWCSDCGARGARNRCRPISSACMPCRRDGRTHYNSAGFLVSTTTSRALPWFESHADLMLTKIGSPGSCCDTTANEEPTITTDMIGFMESVV